MRYTIAQAAAKTGLTTHTLRYYEKEGLLPFVERNASGIRSFKDSDFEWLGIICCLKNTGMQIKDIKEFIGWCMEGDSTLEKRRQMFVCHKAAVEKQIEALQNYLKNIDYKIWYYTTACEAGTEAIHKSDKNCSKAKVETNSQLEKAT
ncbi:MAG TPA: MerR family transcriptional regulator [Caproiciproducens sp.]|nr:MerR family transcriptional regulator [Caproiciproducens sp.]